MASGDVVLRTTGGAACALADSDEANNGWRVELIINGVAASVPSTAEGNSESNVTAVLNGAAFPLALQVNNNGSDELPFSTAKTYDITITEH